eukprot:TRINITY_DN950_c0_g1_i1.p1 TRINITY_DN950_c0_g1~~TRINITY_DN950_c0_g1_i1.p1  ORF type:complete len:308 (+),score=67.65 TRINITY_DN950_c0_g1_i1:79-1002(+)
MTTRNKTLLYIQYRNERKTIRPGGYTTHSKGFEKMEHQKLTGSGIMVEMSDVETGSKNLQMPPGWATIVDDVHYDISRIKQKMQELGICHKNHLVPQFPDSTQDEQTIEILTDQITKMFQGSQSKVTKLSNSSVAVSEKSMKKNIVSALASELHELSLVFRKDQKDYLQKLRGRQQKGKGLFSIDDEELEEEAFSKSFTSEQERISQQSDEAITEREREIKQIAKSITDLASIFKDLSTMVIEQGTILDRIDYNIETVEVNTSQALTNIQKSEKSQKKYRNKLCMLFLCLGVLILILVIIVRAVSKK